MNFDEYMKLAKRTVTPGTLQDYLSMRTPVVENQIRSQYQPLALSSGATDWLSDFWNKLKSGDLGTVALVALLGIGLFALLK